MVETTTDDSTDSQDKEGGDDDGVYYTAGSQGPSREEMAGEYLPGQDEWAAKTIFDLNDPGAAAALKQFDTMFPEVSELQPVIDDFLEQFMKGKTSVGGRSRDEYEGLLTAMYGGKKDGSRSALVDAFAADLDKED